MLATTSDAKIGRLANATKSTSGDRSLHLAKSQFASSGNLMLVNTNFTKLSKADDAGKRRELIKKIPRGKWQRHQKEWIDFAPDTNAEIEKCFHAGESKFSLWDEIILRDIDLANMVALPGHVKLRRIELTS